MFYLMLSLYNAGRAKGKLYPMGARSFNLALTAIADPPPCKCFSCSMYVHARDRHPVRMS